MKIKLTKEQQNLLNGGQAVTTEKGNEYFNLPFWYRKEGNDLFTPLFPDELPGDLLLFLIDRKKDYGVINKKELRKMLAQIWDFYYYNRLGWFRLFGRGLKWKDTSIHKLIFSERNGYSKGFQIGKWRIGYLPCN